MQWRHKKSIILKNKFDILYCKYNRLMFIEAKLILRDDFLSEDAVHETFARIINGQYDIIEDGREKGYLVKACRNVCFDMLNKMSKLSADVELKDEALDYTAIMQDMQMCIRDRLGSCELYRDICISQEAEEATA